VKKAVNARKAFFNAIGPSQWLTRTADSAEGSASVFVRLHFKYLRQS